MATKLEIPLSLLLHGPVDGVFESLALLAVPIAGLLVVSLSLGRIHIVGTFEALLPHGFRLCTRELLGLLLLPIVHSLALPFQLLLNLHALLGHLKVVAAGLCAFVIAASFRVVFFENARRIRLWLRKARTKFGNQPWLLLLGNIRHKERATAIVHHFLQTDVVVRLVAWVFVLTDATRASWRFRTTRRAALAAIVASVCLETR